MTGATSNPTIFAKAITGSDRYDDQLRAAAAPGMRDAQELFFALALDDVRRAADLLRPVYERAPGATASSPSSAPLISPTTPGDDRPGARAVGRLARPNVMIKVPATEAGIPAIEELTARGVNVNVTLLFSFDRYEQVIDAYLPASSAGSPPGSRSTRSPRSRRSSSPASTPRPTPCCPPGRTLRGRVAVANAQRAYAPLPRAFADERWRALRDAGASPQRPLWASTGTKDPAYSDVLYVEQLIAPDVVNTMPEATLRAFADHGEVSSYARRRPRVTRRTPCAAPAPRASTFRALTAALEREGVRSFCDAYRQLLGCIETKLPHGELAGPGTGPPAGT